MLQAFSWTGVFIRIWLESIFFFSQNITAFSVLYLVSPVSYSVCWSEDWVLGAGFGVWANVRFGAEIWDWGKRCGGVRVAIVELRRF
jgi:hypothetical protein